MRRSPALLILIAAAASAQPTVAPSPGSVGTVRGKDSGGYNFTNSFEAGARGLSTSGNELRYRSDVNFRSGVRLFGSRLAIHSKEGHGKWFDEISLSTQGLGNDPYQFSSLRVQHNRWYRYDMLWRINDYVNPGLTGGLLPGHVLNTRRQWQDHDFVFLPGAPIKFLAGYSRNSQDGPALSTGQFFDSRGDEFAHFGNIGRRQSEYRAGFEANAAGFKLIVLRGWQRYNEDTATGLSQASPGANPNDRTTLTSLRITEPYKGDTPFWRVNLLNEKKSWYAVNARFSYAGGKRNFLFDETALGTDRLGNNRNRQIVIAGDARRPLTTGGLTFSLFPTQKLILTNHASFHQIRMSGDSSYREVNNGSLLSGIFRFNTLSVRTFTNSSDASYRAARWLSAFAGFRISSRRTQSIEGERFGADIEQFRYSQSNRLNAGTFGVRLTPMRPLSVVLDTEIGRQDRPFLPTSQKDYHIAGGRVQYKAKSVTVSAASRANYNFNSGSLFTHSSRNRSQSVDVSWAGKSGLSADAGYNHLHADALTGLAYFASFNLITGDQSVYVSNIHSIFGHVNFSIAKRADLTFGWTRAQDTGDGRSRATAVSTSRPGTALPILQSVQTYPMLYQSPLARVSVRLHSRVRWNGGYQYYHFSEDFGVPAGGPTASQGYNAHTLYTSILWSF
ncbi:MAG: hypothetical protein FJW39_21105 [Acidobacteria bacterium]|nr:hypothetical protein [Acidobacteriota bacterium]